MELKDILNLKRDTAKALHTEAVRRNREKASDVHAYNKNCDCDICAYTDIAVTLANNYVDGKRFRKP